MQNDDYLKSIRTGIDHLNTFLDPKWGLKPEAYVAHIEAGTGDPFMCKSLLSDYATVKALLAWFEQENVDLLRQWACTSARLTRAMYQEKPTGVCFTATYLMPLLSNDSALIRWFAQFDHPFSSKGSVAETRINNPRMDEFRHYNAWLALSGAWGELKIRCASFLSDVPVKQKAYAADHRFHLALAEGDIAGMEAALAELVDPKMMQRRTAEESGYTQNLICTSAVVYAKIAWRHGYQVKVESPWVPRQWLPIVPLSEYKDPFAFMSQLGDSMPIASQ
jgi:hypothetical protein